MFEYDRLTTEEAQILRTGLESLHLSASEQSLEQAIQYLDLLEKWNGAINLTAIRQRDRMLTLHLMDSWTLVPFIKDSELLLDVGSGGGFPGIPVALIRPDLSITLMESNQKKVAFLKQAKIELGLYNLEVIGERVEQSKPDKLYNVITCRAFSDLSEFVRSTRHLLAKGGEWIAMKGAIPYDEINRLPAEISTTITPIQIPGLKAERHLIHLRPSL
ncbi:16S rRNA (guanine(527)-N(7))-methyltransferase RsmG [Ferrovum myxofaciens]|uniref:Ribosomal RNA small subunit methyltransferase G n=1 Tax=Ferrovum myxofaciens TaxID=416213 RepID=A0A9E6MV92_9PROT|nr:16S rRNA (guanine(527)-N(7))-methyltransferase RsmG [Ferrovum myxofaciens]QKE38751.1 MAG: 16S rRNA (guanine(527)-N(7))-methyltransferase RsmG [Ferrovum myxofaciens]QKE41315.1 MAG: 16S rRNA (guanine(527)-N(7))-methyltransferase RsmG [Ferrovum myxofaciens]QWY73956.1 MAG: 16S rRNA (guanine(527)-N(7))-methyltransferase RsmG [Ferrovum myxofaciens]QWY76709.1 MAG: 16S rRNA (guanine(527)-N(7))-methyltransferase RsmG [Ferrovum myxofaciens]